LRAIVDIAAAADDDAIVDDADFAVDVQLLLHEVLLLALEIAAPLLLRHFPAVEHGRLRDGGGGRYPIVPQADLVAVGFEFPLLIQYALCLLIVGFVALTGCIVYAFAHNLLGLRALHILVLDARLLFLLHHLGGLVQAVVGAQIEEEDVVARIDAFLLDLPKDGEGATVDGSVLVIHDCASACSGVITQVAREPGNGGNKDDDAKFTAFLAGSDAGVDDGAADHIVHRGLFFAGCGDKELVLNVDVVFRIADDLTVGVLNAVFCQDATAPVGAAANDLRVHGAGVLVGPGFGSYVRQGMVDVLAHRMCRPLNGYEVLKVPFSTLHCKPVIARGPLIFVALDEIPAKNEVLCNVIDTISNKTHGDVMPWHAAIVCFAELV